MFDSDFNRTAYTFNKEIIENVLKICAPLFDHTCVKNFRYMRMYKNYKYFSVGTNLQYLERYLQTIEEPGKVFEPKKIFSGKSLKPSKNGFTYFLWPNEYVKEIKDPLYNILFQHDVWHGFTVSKACEDYVETWSFSTAIAEEGTTQFYINNLDLLDRFVLHFNAAMSDYTKLIRNEQLAVFRQAFDLKCEKQEFIRPPADSFLTDQTSASGKLSILSQKEFECLIHSVQGKTMKIIANEMNISPRTVEAHINSIKRKTNILYKSELFELISPQELAFYQSLLERK